MQNLAFRPFNTTNLLLLAALVLTTFIYCQSNKEVASSERLPYVNLHDTVKYVGMETCRSCHQSIYESFIKTGMGQSFDHATPQKSSATFTAHTVIYDSIGNYHYQPFWRNDSLFIKEFRLQNKDTIHQQEQHIKYIVGSGQHTNSHIYEENNYLFQAPITFYTQKGIWDLAPGFEGGFSSRFNRIIGMECMSCHNSLPNFVEGSENKFLSVPKGISCERCHGPGEAHVKEKLANIIVDTAKYVDYTIVNPRDLPRDLQMSVCQRCHMQGVMVLQDGKKFDDFRPAMHLKEVMDIYLPEFDGHETQFIMASHAHRTQKSLCYKKSNMTCITCHNPHISVKQTPRATFNQACINCHQPSNVEHKKCLLPENQRISQNNNDCSGCHMPMSGSIDIPHVRIHDHFIRKPIPEEAKQKIEQFIELACVNNPVPTPLSKAKGLLHYFESYKHDPNLLDSAAYYLKQIPVQNPIKMLEPLVHLHYLKKDYTSLLAAAKKVKIHQIKDGWTAYRIGEAYLQQNKLEKAQSYLEKAAAILPLQLDFQNKLGVALMQQNKIDAAQKVFDFILTENDKHVSALTNLGYVYVNMGEMLKAKNLYDKALALDPDYEGALLNLAGWHLQQQQKNEAKKLIQKVLQKNPNNGKAKTIWKKLKRIL